jgi:DNA-binding Lrp family transcriptional regulator
MAGRIGHLRRNNLAKTSLSGIMAACYANIHDFMGRKMPNNLDAIDRRILAALQRNGRMSNVELATEVGLSPSPCLRRVKLLEESGIIDRYVAVLDGAKMGVGLTVFARIWFKTQDAEITHQFAETVRKFPEVMECYLTTGECDAIMRIVTADLHAYWRFQSDYLMRIPSVQSVKTDVPMETIKRTYELPLG